MEKKNCQVKHVSKICNTVAHQLAKLALSLIDDLVWLEDPLANIAVLM